MSFHKHKSIGMLALVALTACGTQHPSSVQATAAAAGPAPEAAPSSIDTKLFYNFPLALFPRIERQIQEHGSTTKLVADLAKDNGDERHQWGLYGFQEWGGFDHGSWILNLETGGTVISIPHTGRSHSTRAPTAGGNLFAYLDDLAEIKQVYKKIGVPQQVLDYISSVEAYVPTVAKDQVRASGDHYDVVPGKTTVIHVKYNTGVSRDVLVELRTTNWPNPEPVAASGRVTVPAGMGEVDVKIAVPTKIDPRMVCAVSLIVPVGSTAMQAVAQGDGGLCETPAKL